MTNAQQTALNTINARYTAEVSAERARWGEASAQSLASKGVNVDDLNRRTVLALAKAGLIVLSSATVETSELRKGAFGSWSGSRRSRYVSLCARPA